MHRGKDLHKADHLCYFGDLVYEYAVFGRFVEISDDVV
jgi:hypothetical protein